VSPNRFENLGNNLARYRATGVIYVRKSFRRYKIPNLFASTETDKINKAKAKAEKLEKEHLDYYLHGIRPASGIRFGSGKSVSDVIDEFQKYETPYNRRQGTKENHGYYFAELKREWGHVQIEHLTENRWKEWLKEFKLRKERSTFNDYAVYMNMVLFYAHKKDYLRKRVKLPFEDTRKETGRVFTKAELDALFVAMGEDTRDQFILSYECAMRLREVLHLTWERVNLTTGEITLRKEDVKTGSRTGKGRAFFATEPALERLRKRFDRLGNASPFVFPSKDGTQPIDQNKTAWKAAKRRAGIQGKARWHDLRHTIISELLLVHKIPIVSVSRYVGASARTLERVYLHSTAEETRLVAQAVRISRPNDLKVI
jgi:integrase